MVRKFGSGGRAAGIAVISVLAMALAACSTSLAGGTSSSAASGGASSSAIVAQATANVTRDFADNNAAFSLPPVKDPNALRGKTLMYLSAGLSSPAGTAGLAALKTLEPLLGFKLVVYDGQFTPSKYQDGMGQAIAQHVNVLMLYGVDCAGNEAALRQVRAAGIKIVGLQSVDCNASDPGAQAMFDTEPLYPLGDGSGPVGAVWAANGAAQADYLISKLKGNVKVIQFDVPDFAVTADLGKGFKGRIAQCSTCQIVDTVNVGVADFGSNLQQKASQALLQHPEANAVEIDYDDLVTLGVQAAISASGRQNSLLTIAGTGYATTLQIIRQGKGLDAGWVQDFEWDHYAGIDAALRLLSGQKPAIDGIPVILYDKAHNLPASGAFAPQTNFQAVFLKAWGQK